MNSILYRFIIKAMYLRAKGSKLNSNLTKENKVRNKKSFFGSLHMKLFISRDRKVISKKYIIEKLLKLFFIPLLAP